MKNEEFFKYLALGSFGIYLYKKFQNNPKSLGSPEELKEKAFGLIDKVSKDKNISPVLNQKAKIIAEKYIHAKMGIKDVTPLNGRNS